MAFELYTDGNVIPFPSSTDLRVRFLFHNGTSSATSEPTIYPLFGSDSLNTSWTDFTAGMGKFSIGDQKDWCTACGNTTGICSNTALSASGGHEDSPSSKNPALSGNGLSPVINGVIGAMVTLAVILGLEAIVLLVGGYRIMSKKTIVRRTGAAKV